MHVGSERRPCRMAMRGEQTVPTNNNNNKNDK